MAHFPARPASSNLPVASLAVPSLAEFTDAVIVPIADVHRGTVRTRQYPKRLSTNVRAVRIITNTKTQERIEHR